MLIFVTGGARSGKSDFAMSLAEKSGKRPVYIATARPGDSEMLERIERHKQARGDGWETIEEPINISEAVSGLSGGERAVVLDCITLWLTNLLMAEGDGLEVVATEKTRELVVALKGLDGTAIVVSGELGMGIVPENALARYFRDVAGNVNRVIAEASDEVYLVVSGIPVKIKP
jgi:adenosylcobinamide kinase/adenosylcobinamide-phosphate guanylyltransferase